ncbi:TPA: NrdH-redoxin [Candidatus Saccharibacteria bacterium]|nr:NrdH-redoxin [Candidatus Saccharibacteria bacterium]HIO87266.1 NrdH-redoxin [Candidatus Saccharibacteria bacterium]
MADVTIYSTPTCGFCHMAKSYFQSNDIEYEEKDVSRDADLQKEMIEKSNQMGVPVIDIDGKIVVGFNRPAIDSLLREAKLL